MSTFFLKNGYAAMSNKAQNPLNALYIQRLRQMQCKIPAVINTSSQWPGSTDFPGIHVCSVVGWRKNRQQGIVVNIDKNRTLAYRYLSIFNYNLSSHHVFNTFDCIRRHIYRGFPFNVPYSDPGFTITLKLDKIDFRSQLS